MSEQSRNEREYRAAEFARHFLDDNDFAFLETAPKHDQLLKSITKGEFEFIFSPFIPKQEIMENISSRFYQISSLVVFLIPLAYIVSVILFFVYSWLWLLLPILAHLIVHLLVILLSRLELHRIPFQSEIGYLILLAKGYIGIKNKIDGSLLQKEVELF